MATSKGSGGAGSKSAAGKKSAAPSKSTGSNKGASPSRGAGKAVAPARGGSSSRTAATAVKAAAKKSPAAGARGAAASAKSATPSSSSRNTATGKSVPGGSTAVKATTGRGGAAASAKSPAPRAASSRAKGGKAAGDARNDLEKILQDLMKDIYYAEKKLSKALGKMSKNATEPKLKDAFTTHQTQTDEQVSKLEEAFGLLGLAPKAKKCAAMDGLLEEANEHIEEYKKGAGLDAALIVGAQKVEHYEIAAYGSMCSFAKTLGYEEAAAIFEEIREQESDTDELLTTLAESIINLKAEEETEDVEGGGQSSAAGAGTSEGSADSESGEDSSSASSGSGNDMNAGEGASVSGMTDGNNREGSSETGEAMGY